MIREIDVMPDVFEALKNGGDFVFVHGNYFGPIETGDVLAINWKDNCRECGGSAVNYSGCQSCGTSRKQEPCRACDARGYVRGPEAIKRTAKRVVRDFEPLGRGLSVGMLLVLLA